MRQEPPHATQLKGQVGASLAALEEDLGRLSQQVRDTPELGFAEEHTSEAVADWLACHGLTPRRTDPVHTGLRADVAGGQPGPTVALLGELDAVHVPAHPDADPVTGAAHACGHHASLAAACGAAAALATVMPQLAGRLTFLATPAEEILPESSRTTRGRTELPTGKAELIRHGVFDDVDMALMVHTGREGGPRFSVGDTLNGAVRISAVFQGVAAHSGSSPWLGVDAVRAARLAMDAVDAQKDYLPDTEKVRIAQQLIAPSTAAGATPAECRLEVMVRAKSLDGLQLTMERVDRALYSGAVAIGADLHRRRELVYAPLRSSRELDDLVANNARQVIGAGEQARGRHLGASTDMGDLALLMPVSHPYASGAVGHHHSPTFRVDDHRQATIEPALYLATTVVDLLCEGANRARAVIDADSRRMSRAGYLDLRRRMSGTRSSWPQLNSEEHR